MGPRSERKLEMSRRIVYPISRFHIVRVDMRKPSNAALFDGLEVFAMLVEQSEILLSLVRKSDNHQSS